MHSITIISIMVIIFILILSIAFLIFPLNYNIYLKYEKDVEVQTEVLSPFKLLKIRLFIKNNQIEIRFYTIDNHIFTKQISKNRKAKSKKANKKFCFNIEKHFNKTLLNCVFSYVNELIRLLKPSYIEIQGAYGFKDPSVTGMLCALLPLIKELVLSNNINLYPNFNDEILDINIKIAGQIILFTLVLKTLIFISKKEVRIRLFKKSKFAKS